MCRFVRKILWLFGVPILLGVQGAGAFNTSKHLQNIHKDDFKRYVAGQWGVSPEKVAGSFWLSKRSPEGHCVSAQTPRLIPFVEPGFDRISTELGAQRFFAFTPGCGAQALIYWRGEFSGYLDANYLGVGNPKWVKQPNSNCIACHMGVQNPAKSSGTLVPVFSSRRFWSQMNEISHQFGNSAISGKSITERIKLALPQNEPYFGFAITDVNGTRLRDSVANGNQLAQAGNVCRSICGDSLECRRSLLEIGLLRQEAMSFLRSDENPPYHHGQYRLFRHVPWIPDQLKSAIAKNWTGFAQQDWSIPDFFGANYRCLDDHLLPECAPYQPSVRRKLVGAIPQSENYVYGISFACFGLLDSDRERVSRFSENFVSERLKSPEATESLFGKSWPPSREGILKFLEIPKLRSEVRGELNPDPMVKYRTEADRDPMTSK